MVKRQRDARSAWRNLMTLDQATRILKHRDGSMHEHAAAAAFVHSFYTSSEGRHLTRPIKLTTDAKPSDDQFERKLRLFRKGLRAMHTRDQTARGEYRQALSETATEGGLDPGSPVGAKLVMVLAGPVSAYFVSSIGANNTGLYRSSDVDSVLDPGRTNTGSGMTGDTLKRIRTADTARSKKTLAEINERNKAFWSQHSG
jgi:hypothetical protein